MTPALSLFQLGRAYLAKGLINRAREQFQHRWQSSRATRWLAKPSKTFAAW